MRLRRREFTRAMAALVGAGSPIVAPAQQFPSKLVRIVPFGTGGGPIDTLARVYAEKLHARWGQTVVVEPKPGASGTIAADFVAKSEPDGHTVLLTLPVTHVNNAILQPKLPFHPVKDFEPLSMLATGGPVLVGRADAPYSSLREFVDFAKKQPKGLTYGTWGTGDIAHLFCELLERQTGVNLIHVPYKSESAAHTDLFGGVLDFAWANAATARAHSQAGKTKVLGITATRRASILPTVPTFAEQGFQGFDIDSWMGMYAPAKTSRSIVEAWAVALREITAMPDVVARITAFGWDPLGNTPSQFRERYDADYPRVAELIKAAGVTPE